MSANQQVLELEAELARERRKLALVQEIGQSLSSALETDVLLELIMEKVTQVMGADRATLYIMSDDRKELWSKITQGSERLEIRLDVGKGIAGTVAATGKLLNIKKPYDDDRFDKSVDLRSGYTTRSILCTPMRDSAEHVIGVLQVLNKVDGAFNEADEELLQALASQVAISIVNSKLYQEVLDQNIALYSAQEILKHRTDELNVLYEIEREVNLAADLDELLHRVLRAAMKLVAVQSGSIALLTPDAKALRFETTAGPVSKELLHQELPRDQGIIGWVVAHNEAVIVNDPGKDPRHARQFAESLGSSVSGLICAPLMIGDGAIGAIELLNKRGKTKEADSRPFSDSDVRLLTLIAGQASRAIQLSRARSEREQQDRLAAVGRVLSGIVHDLRSPMTIITGYADLLVDCDDEDTRREFVDKIQRQFHVMDGMTREVLQFARGEVTLLITKVHVGAFLSDMKKQFEHSFAGRGIKVEMDVGYSGIAYFDQTKLMRALHNLVNNAADALGGHGTIAIKTWDDEGRFVLSVKDNGPGIPGALRHSLFELFASGKSSGTGLGLAIVKRIVDQHRGTIEWESSADAGTCFTISLPVEHSSTVRE